MYGVASANKRTKEIGEFHYGGNDNERVLVKVKGVHAMCRRCRSQEIVRNFISPMPSPVFYFRVMWSKTCTRLHVGRKSPR